MSLVSLWLIIGILLVVSEFLIPGFVIIFFGIGALITAAIAAIVDISVLTQGYCFIAISLGALIVCRKYFRKTFTGKSNPSHKDADDDGIVGAVATVTRAITPPLSGRVAVHGTEWNAVANRPINLGETVKVIHQDNITLTVE